MQMLLFTLNKVLTSCFTTHVHTCP